MIHFFRKIRRHLLSENKFSKYIIYAFGEIILVMIGILLAFQVNSWQDRRTRAKKEMSYLKDIRLNLNDDLETIDEVVEFNERKNILTDSMFYTLGNQTNPEVYMPIVLRYMYTLTNYDIFEPNRIAFDNMVAAENVDLISNGGLRTKLSQYYKREFNTTTQESVKQRSRQLGDYVAIAAFNKQSLKSLVNHDSNLRDVSEVKIHEDPKVYSILFNMLMTTQAQNETLIGVQLVIRELITLIDKEIDNRK